MKDKNSIPAKHSVLDPFIVELIFRILNKKHATVFDYGCGEGDILFKLPKSFDITAFDINSEIIESLSNKIEKLGYENIKIIDKEHLKQNFKNYSKKFDLVLCSLVLCLYYNENALKEILYDLAKLMKKSSILLVVICNPLFIHELNTETVIKHLPDNWRYNHVFKYEKTVKLTNRKRSDVHRPLCNYESLINETNLSIESIIQVPPRFNKEKFISDYLIFKCKLL